MVFCGKKCGFDLFLGGKQHTQLKRLKKCLSKVGKAPALLSPEDLEKLKSLGYPDHPATKIHGKSTDGCPRKLGSMLSRWVISFKLPINEVYWLYNQLIRWPY